MNIVAAVPVDESLASFIGKKGSENSITFYNRKSGADVVVVLVPNQAEDKAYALAESLLIASCAVLSTATLDRRFGEALVACSLLGKRAFVTDDNDASALLKSAGLVDYTRVSKSELLDRLVAGPDNGSEAGVRIDIDKAFPVRGIGTVVLGVVTRGTLRQHDKLVHTSGKEVLVRSMQSQDEDITEAKAGTRVGVSLKDIADDEVEKGDLLTKAHVPRSATLTVEARFNAAAREPVAVGSRYGVASGFAYSECVVKKVDGQRLELALSAPIAVETGDTVLLTRGSIPRIFASGKVVSKA